MIKQVEKRDKTLVEFDPAKILNAIKKSMDSCHTKDSEKEALIITDNVIQVLEKRDKPQFTVEEIQDIVEKELMPKFPCVAKAYILYREKRTQARGNSIDKIVEELVQDKNDYWKNENSNKNSKTVTTQRDYLAGVVSTDYTMRKLLPKDIVEAHNEGIIHFHDADYFLQLALNNCCLINIEDMLQNGTVINGVRIDKPHRIITASTITTQIILGVSSSQYGGCTVSLTHLAPFVRDSYNMYYKRYIERGLDEDTAIKFAKEDTKKEVNDAVQTFNYQVNSMTNTNGQAPFLSVNMYLGETEEYKEELAMLIEEFLNQRILGFKNEKGIYVTPAFPKLLYVLEEDNIHPDSKYYYLTELAAKCTAKRMVPDYISEKMMLKLKGDCYPCINKACA